MDAANPFAQVPTTPEPIIAQVRRQLTDEGWPGLLSHGPLLDRVADRAVREVWDSRIKTFVSVLALRQAREMLRQQAVLISMHQPWRPHAAESMATTRPLGVRQRRDVLPLDEDVVLIDDRDVLHFSARSRCFPVGALRICSVKGWQESLAGLVGIDTPSVGMTPLCRGGCPCPDPETQHPGRSSALIPGHHAAASMTRRFPSGN